MPYMNDIRSEADEAEAAYLEHLDSPTTYTPLDRYDLAVSLTNAGA